MLKEETEKVGPSSLNQFFFFFFLFLLHCKAGRVCYDQNIKEEGTGVKEAAS